MGIIINDTEETDDKILESAGVDTAIYKIH